MSYLIFIKAIFLGLIEGLTEFIPVSSTGHLILFSNWINFDNGGSKVFEIAIQTGAIFAVIFLYKQKLFHTLFTIFDKKEGKESRHFAITILIAFLPAAVFGFLFHNTIKTVLFSVSVVAISLILGGIAMILIEKFGHKRKIKDIEKVDFTTALKIGFFQLFALIPGVSRSGATIMGGLLCGLKRQVSTEFSFFLAIPTIIGATCYDLYKNYEYLTYENFLVIVVGLISSFIFSIMAIKWLINFISKHSFLVFGYYRIIIGSLILVWMFLIV
ncbi:undecaprenyl-diphosphate phosphatase [Pseudomonadota bacterium]